jgi:hypothetical protein
MLAADPSRYSDVIWSCISDASHSHPIPPTGKLTQEQKDLITRKIIESPANVSVTTVIDGKLSIFSFNIAN